MLIIHYSPTVRVLGVLGQHDLAEVSNLDLPVYQQVKRVVLLSHELVRNFLQRRDILAEFVSILLGQLVGWYFLTFGGWLHNSNLESGSSKPLLATAGFDYLHCFWSVLGRWLVNEDLNRLGGRGVRWLNWLHDLWSRQNWGRCCLVELSRGLLFRNSILHDSFEFIEVMFWGDDLSAPFTLSIIELVDISNHQFY